ncbi:Quinol monooxygenase YgiN [Geodermatophilus telluris]|uniref:Quinol monooxygenase YgiN n=1 Tax=Geodermatophilus telluris TaxID=1190417 RepID=A0A1G6P6S8_9ACTN|nr:antibiotic biosynthesis monooxygenase [Geodermatophilus telluris]SDC75105.1 Quinol monooxygenase YgiN [Geodermatophilus telluris]
MFSQVVRVRVRAGRREEFLAGVTATAEAAVRDEPGCLRVEVCEVAGEPDAFVVSGLYADDAAFAAHGHTPHAAAWQRVAERTVVPGSEVGTAGRVLVGHCVGAWAEALPEAHDDEEEQR